MHDIEPHYHWRDEYIASEDSQSPFFGREYDEFAFSQKVYNYYIHPQWDSFGSSTLYTKVLYANYEQGVGILEMIGEWNDCLHNDIMFLKRELIDPMIEAGITKFILIAENVLNFHSSEDDYYQEWREDVAEEGGWICILNALPHVAKEMNHAGLYNYVFFEDDLQFVNWRPQKPMHLYQLIEQYIFHNKNLLPTG